MVGLEGRLRESVCSWFGRDPDCGRSKWPPVVTLEVDTILRERRGLAGLRGRSGLAGLRGRSGLAGLRGSSGLEGATEVEDALASKDDTDNLLRMLGGT